MTATISMTKRGSLTLPPPMRRKLGLDKLRNPLLLVEERDGGIFLQAAAALPVRDIPAEKIRQWLVQDRDDMKTLRHRLKK